MAADDSTKDRSFSQGAGRWLGAAEVYDGAGRFKGNGQDTRQTVVHGQEDHARTGLAQGVGVGGQRSHVDAVHIHERRIAQDQRAPFHRPCDPDT